MMVETGQKFVPLLLVLVLYSLPTDAGVRIRRNDPWRVTTIEDYPYTKKKVPNPQKNEDYEGYIPELLKKIGDHLEQQYTISIVGDGKYGAKDAPNKWSGMIGEVFDGKADVAAAAITVSDARKEAVNFTEPLMKIRPVIVMLKPADGSTPKIKSAQELAGQTDVKYGVVKDGTTLHLIRDSKEPHFQTMNQELTNNQDQLVNTSEDGINQVRKANGKFAFITESATGEYWAKRLPCDLVIVDTGLPQKEYAFAVAKSSPIKAKLDLAIEFLRNNGELDKTANNWWLDQCSGGVRLALGSLLVPLGILMKLVVVINVN